MKMEDKFNQWFQQVDGKPIESEDPTNLDQCFDLAFNWCDFLQIPRDSIRHFRAYQIFTDPNPDTTDHWDIFANTPTGVPQIGDLVIWGTLIGISGHVAIFKEGNASSFRSEDQNWAGLQKAHLTNHSYNGVLGWLRPKISHDSAIIAQPITQSDPIIVQPDLPQANDVSITPPEASKTSDTSLLSIFAQLGDFFSRLWLKKN